MKIRFWLTMTLLCLLKLSAGTQYLSGQALNLHNLYSTVSGIYQLVNTGSEVKAQTQIDSILNLQTPNYRDVIWGFLFNYLAGIQHHQGNYYLSKKCFQLSSIYAKVYTNKTLNDYTYNNFILLLIESQDTTETKSLMHDQITHSKLSESDILQFGIYTSRAFNAIYNHQPERAKEEFRGLERLRKVIPESDPIWVIADRLYGIYFQDIGQLASAQYYLRKAALHSEKINGKKHFQTGQSYLRLGDYYTRIKIVDSAQFYYEQANQVFFESDKGNPDTAIPFAYESVFIESLIKLGQTLKQKDSLPDAYSNFQLAIERINRISHAITSESSRFILADKGRQAFDAGIACALELFTRTGDKRYFIQGINWSIQAKSLSLNQLFEREQIYTLAGIPEELTVRIKGLRNRLDKLFSEISEPVQAESLDTLVRAILDYKNAERLIQNSYEKIRVLRDQNQVYQTALLPMIHDAVYLGYQELDSVIVVFAIDQAKQEFSMIPKNQVLLAGIEQFKQIISTKPLNVYSLQEVKQHSELGYTLFSKLVEPFISDYKGNRIIIQADGCLSGLPFEALIYGKPVPGNFKDQAYLMNEYQIQYMATSMFGKQQALSDHAGLEIITCRSASGIPQASREASNLFSNNQNCTYYYLDDLQWKSDSSSFSGKRIHIASHAVVNLPNPMSSGLACSSDGLPVILFSDILAMKLRSSHVFINGCQSGNGPLNHGEGLMSLGLAVALAGSGSVIQHLWAASDRASEELSGHYYRFIKRLTDAEALQRSKQQYLRTCRSGMDHPYYWSGVVCFSGYEPVSRHKNLLLWLIGAVVIGALSYLSFRKRNRR